MNNKNIEILRAVHQSLCNGIRNAKAARKWLSDRKLSIEVSGACFQSGQLHHRKSESYKEDLEQVGFLTRSHINTRKGGIGYVTFAPDSVLFPLKDVKGQVVNFYAIRINTAKTGFLNEQGIYPEYPKVTTRKLYVTQSALDAATLLESRILDNREAVIALNEGAYTNEHVAAIEQLNDLQEIIFIETEKE